MSHAGKWYNMYMRNWSTDIRQLSKYPTKLQKFVLESLINFGTQGQKINGPLLKKHMKNLDIDHKKKEYLKILIG